MKYIFIVNEKAGKGKYKKIVPKIEIACKKRNYDYEIKYITDQISGKDIALTYKDQENVIYVVGGDGTITKTLPGIVGTKNKLGIIPAGSGNDTYRATKKLPKGETRIDLGKINDTYFINVACTGLDAEVANNVDLLRNTIIPSNQLYNASIIYTFIHYKFKNIRFLTKVKTFESEYSIISICNGSHYGGGYHIAPKSMLTDGMLDIYYVEKMHKLQIIPLLLKLKNGQHEGKRRVHKFKSNHIELQLKEDITFNVDGEKLKGNNFVIDILEKELSVYNDNELIEEIVN